MSNPGSKQLSDGMVGHVSVFQVCMFPLGVGALLKWYLHQPFIPVHDILVVEQFGMVQLQYQ